MSHYKPYLKYKDSGVEWIGEVPEHWTVMQLKRAASICNGQDYKDIEDVDGAYPVIGSGGEFARASSFIFNGESVLLGRKGTIDKPLYINGPFWTVDTMFYTKIASDACPKFVYYSALNIPFSFYSTNTALPSMTGEALSSHLIAAPKLTEQRDIANSLDRETARIDAIIAKKTSFIELLKEKRSALITHTVTKGINPNVKMKDSGVEWIGEVPEHWERRKIAHAFECIGSGTTPPSDQDKWYSDGEIPWITTGELRETVITETSKCVTTKALEEFSTLRLYPAGSLAMAMYGATIGRLGILGVPATTNQACCVLSGEISLSIRYAYFWLLAFKQQIIDLYAAGGGQPNINQEVIAFLRVPAPNLVEQATITAFLDRETARIDLLTQKTQHSIDLLKERRSALITAAVTGQIDLRESA
jgi:type I restriction enzyme S subunit